ncbi:PilZ domain-containing protein [Lentzea nigeriaca]|uniref:PilZ domain-containing protein n=1 Tax=Lentzea nigeriaca TaxID=1128665 RepID=UPI00195B3981|nr:PilZ domain-containing protein [Lentzea nigeriaca]MBM7865007.1 hypothetical protein [Lentzea nigeriaca]
MQVLPWLAHGAAIWVAVNAVILTAAVHRIRRQRFGAERRAAVRFERTGTITVDGALCQIRDVSLTGASIAAPDRLPAPGQQVHVRLRLGNTTISMPATVQSTVGDDRQIAGLNFSTISATQQAELALALFATGSIPTLTPTRPTAEQHAA